MWYRTKGGKPHTRERNVMAAVEQILLRPKKIISLWTGSHFTTRAASTKEGELLVRDLRAVLLCEVGGLEYMPRRNRGQLLEFELVNASGGEREEEQCRECREEHGGQRSNCGTKANCPLLALATDPENPGIHSGSV